MSSPILPNVEEETGNQLPVTNPAAPTELSNEVALLSEVQDICTQRNETGCDQRNFHSLTKELYKRKPNEDCVLYYTDLLFEKRRQELIQVGLSERLDIIQTKYPTILSKPDQTKTSMMFSIYSFAALTL